MLLQSNDPPAGTRNPHENCVIRPPTTDLGEQQQSTQSQKTALAQFATAYDYNRRPPQPQPGQLALYQAKTSLKASLELGWV